MDSQAKLVAAQRVRDEAKASLDADLARLRGEPRTNSIQARITGQLKEDARAGLDQAIDIARESKGIIAGAAALLALWFLREPILTWVTKLLDQLAEESDDYD